uniref:Uncharacterized protein n=1 Tax=Arundo donax TaxID=35708 RepID=A0A0A9DAG0_ARUDO
MRNCRWSPELPMPGYLISSMLFEYYQCLSNCAMRFHDINHELVSVETPGIGTVYPCLSCTRAYLL